METKDLDYFEFVWFTDGCGWRSAKNNLKEKNMKANTQKAYVYWMTHR